MKQAARFLSIMVILCAMLAAAEPTLDAKALKRAQALSDEGDLSGALPLIFAVMRNAPNADLAHDAREQLEHMGLTGQEIFKLDPVALKGEELESLLLRLRATSTLRRRQELDMDHAEGLLELAVVPKSAANGEIGVQVQVKELAQALELLIQVALSEVSSDKAREAQALLARMGISGPRAEVVKKACAEGKLPPDVESLVVCSACLGRLERYQKVLNDPAEDVDALAHKRAALDIGLGLYKYLRTLHAQAPAVKTPSDLMDFWQSQTVPGRTELKY